MHLHERLGGSAPCAVLVSVSCDVRLSAQGGCTYFAVPYAVSSGCVYRVWTWGVFSVLSVAVGVFSFEPERYAGESGLERMRHAAALIVGILPHDQLFCFPGCVPWPSCCMLLGGLLHACMHHVCMLLGMRAFLSLCFSGGWIVCAKRDCVQVLHMWHPPVLLGHHSIV